MGFETARHLANLGMHVIIGRLLSSDVLLLSQQFPKLMLYIHNFI